MDRPSSSSHQPAVLSEGDLELRGDFDLTPGRGPVVATGRVVIASFGEAVAIDYAAYVAENGAADVVLIADERIGGTAQSRTRTLPIEQAVAATSSLADEVDPSTSLILFIHPRMTARDHDQLDRLLAFARRSQVRFVGIVSSFRFHLDDPEVVDCENGVRARAAKLGTRLAVFRPGHVVSRNSGVGKFLGRFAPFYRVAPGRLRTCFITGDEFFRAVETIRLSGPQSAAPVEPWHGAGQAETSRAVGSRVHDNDRAYTLLGPNERWRDMLDRHRGKSFFEAVLAAIGAVLSWLQLGQVMTVLATLCSRWSWWLRQWNVKTLHPRSLRELLSLCHSQNINHVRVVGYNNGVVHFGHRHPGKTIVSTVQCRTLAQSGANTLKADCGVTVRGALDYLARNDRELYVVPNYSYVCLGTAFFVPIHGSAVDFSTVADTICRVVFYDPVTDRIIAAARGDAAFREHVYNLRSQIVLLRLYILSKPKTAYFVRRQTLENPTASQLLAALSDPDSSNVEIRQSSAASPRVTISRYFKEAGDTASPALELPRDALGRLWDRLEENPVTSFLMHALSRHVAWHTELFFTPDEFEVFWRTHAQVPLRKIQLRYLKRDGLPHSPCRDQDCVSSDMFIFRWNKARLFDYLKSTFSNVRTNPGKHSN